MIIPMINYIGREFENSINDEIHRIEGYDFSQHKPEPRIRTGSISRPIYFNIEDCTLIEEENMTETILGKMTNVKFGIHDGYLFGLSFTLSGEHSVDTGIYFCTDETDSKHIHNRMDEIKKLMLDAKVDNINDLNNTPMKFKFEDGLLKEYRVLEEVL